jgi:hypothetical protein
MINQTWKLASVHSHGVKMATELHHPDGRTHRAVSLPEVPGICHFTSLDVDENSTI